MWASTFQKVPTEIDERLQAAGATRSRRAGRRRLRRFRRPVPRLVRLVVTLAGEALGWLRNPKSSRTPTGTRSRRPGNAYTAHSFSALDATASPRGRKPGIAHAGRHDQAHRRIHPPHRVPELPDGVTYRTGDHIALLPAMPPNSWTGSRPGGTGSDELVVIRPNTAAPSHLPLDTPFVVSELLSARVELQAPLTRAQIKTLAEFATDPDEQAELCALAADGPENINNATATRSFSRGSACSTWCSVTAPSTCR